MKKLMKIQKNKGMTYVELIVVLSIFSIMTSIVLFNYGEFQAKVDIRNLASDIALKIVEAQKSSLSGRFPPATHTLSDPSTWKPSYGLFFDVSTAIAKTSFIYFTDLDYTDPPPKQNGFFEGTACTDECLEKIDITKGNSITRLDVFYQDSSTISLNYLTVSFKRPDSSAIIKSSPPLNPNISYAQITISSPSSSTAIIKIYPSGRIQIN